MDAPGNSPARCTSAQGVELNRKRLEGHPIPRREAHRGSVPLFLSIRMAPGPVAFLECNEHFSVLPSMELEDAVKCDPGCRAYYARADTSLPSGRRGNGSAARQRGGGRVRIRGLGVARGEIGEHRGQSVLTQGLKADGHDGLIGGFQAMSFRATLCFCPTKSVRSMLVCVSASRRPARVSPDFVVTVHSR